MDTGNNKMNETLELYNSPKFVSYVGVNEERLLYCIKYHQTSQRSKDYRMERPTIPVTWFGKGIWEVLLPLFKSTEPKKQPNMSVIELMLSERKFHQILRHKVNDEQAIFLGFIFFII